MEKIYIEASEDKPSVRIEPDKSLLRIYGASYPENSTKFYHDIIQWLKDNGTKMKDEFVCDFYFNYINSASKKSVYELMLVLENLKKSGIKIYVKWNYDIYDDDMLEMGREFLEMTDLPYMLIPRE